MCIQKNNLLYILHVGSITILNIWFFAVTYYRYCQVWKIPNGNDIHTQTVYNWRRILARTLAHTRNIHNRHGLQMDKIFAFISNMHCCCLTSWRERQKNKNKSMAYDDQLYIAHLPHIAISNTHNICIIFIFRIMLNLNVHHLVSATIHSFKQPPHHFYHINGIAKRWNKQFISMLHAKRAHNSHSFRIQAMERERERASEIKCYRIRAGEKIIIPMLWKIEYKFPFSLQYK